MLPLLLAFTAEDVRMRPGALADPIFLLACVALIAVQSFGEELFRSSSITPLARRGRFRFAIGVSAFFALVHAWNPDIAIDPLPGAPVDLPLRPVRAMAGGADGLTRRAGACISPTISSPCSAHRRRRAMSATPPSSPTPTACWRRAAATPPTRSSILRFWRVRGDGLARGRPPLALSSRTETGISDGR